MGVEKKITITGVDSYLVEYEFTSSPVVTPGAFVMHQNDDDKDIARNRKIVEVTVHDAQGVLLYDEKFGANENVEVEIETSTSPIVVRDETIGNVPCVSLKFSRDKARPRNGGLYRPNRELRKVEINNTKVQGFGAKGTIEVFYNEKKAVGHQTA